MSSLNLPNEPTLTIKEACVIAGVSRRTVYNWIDAGKLRYRRTVGGAIRIFRESLFVDSDSPQRKVAK